MTPPSPADVLAAYDRQVRQRLQIALPGWTMERTGPDGRVLRSTGPSRGGQMSFIGFTDLDDATVDAAISGELANFAELGGHSEWKVYGHDRPADLGARLEAAGLVPEELEALVVGRTEDVLATGVGAVAPAGVIIRPAEGADDYAGIAAMHGEVWGRDDSWLAAELAEEHAAGPDLLDVYVAVAAGRVVSSAWIRFLPGTDFAGLWGGSTLEDWRHRGIYRALVDVRARRAHERGVEYLQVDASPNSEPILARLGLEKLTWTRPYAWPVGE